jgi:hypothetical protein
MEFVLPNMQAIYNLEFLEFVWLVYISAGFTEFASGFRLLADSGYRPRFL